MHPLCLNCNRPLTDTDTFCPSCGQENKANRVRIGTFLLEFSSNYFAFDSKFSRSVSTFLFKPGKLTACYNDGKRVQYVHPLRLYLIISFLFFLLLSLLVDRAVEENSLSMGTDFISNSQEPRQATPAIINDSTALHSGSLLEVRGASDSAKVIIVDNSKESGFLSLMRYATLSDQQVLDSLDMDKASYLQTLFVHQGRKVFRKELDIFVPYLIKNLPIMMFLIMPFFAFYLFVLFRKHEQYYISHLIHALHLHSFSFLVLIIFLALAFFINTENYMPIGFLLITLYAFLSIKKVYGESWLKTLFKFNILGFFYFMTLIIGVTMEVLISFALF